MQWSIKFKMVSDHHGASTIHLLLRVTLWPNSICPLLVGFNSKNQIPLFTPRKKKELSILL